MFETMRVEGYMMDTTPDAAAPAQPVWYLRSGAQLDLSAKLHSGTPQYRGLPVMRSADRADITEVVPCSRCGGAGSSVKWEHTGLTCYDCGGSGVRGTRQTPIYSAEKLQKLDLAATKRQAKAQAQQAEAAKAREDERLRNLPAVQEQNRADYPEAMAILETADLFENDFLLEMRRKASEGVPLTDKMATAIVAAHQRAKARHQWDLLVAEIEARCGAAPTGRTVVKGYVLSAQWRQSGEGFYASEVLKLLVLDERGFKVWCKSPKGLSGALERDEDGQLNLGSARGLHVEFKVTLTPKEYSFAFGSRAGKLERLNHEPVTEPT